MILRRAALGLMILTWQPALVGASEPAKIESDVSRIEDFGSDLRIELALSRPVAWDAYTLDAPRRLVMEFDGLRPCLAGLDGVLASDHVFDITSHPGDAPGRVRIVMSLASPLRIETAGLSESGARAAIKLQLAPTSAEEFSRAAGPPAADGTRPDGLRPVAAPIPGEEDETGA